MKIVRHVTQTEGGDDVVSTAIDLEGLDIDTTWNVDDPIIFPLHRYITATSDPEKWDGFEFVNSFFSSLSPTDLQILGRFYEKSVLNVLMGDPIRFHYRNILKLRDDLFLVEKAHAYVGQFCDNHQDGLSDISIEPEKIDMNALMTIMLLSQVIFPVWGTFSVEDGNLNDNDKRRLWIFSSLAEHPLLRNAHLSLMKLVSWHCHQTAIADVRIPMRFMFGLGSLCDEMYALIITKRFPLVDPRRYIVGNFLVYVTQTTKSGTRANMMSAIRDPRNY